MTGLKEMLMEEHRMLQDICRRLEQNLQNRPEGTLRTTNNKGVIQFYHTLPREDSGEEPGKKNKKSRSERSMYIPKSQSDLIKGLAQKAYEERMLKAAGRREKQLSRIIKDYEDDEMEMLFRKEHPNRQKLIEPLVPLWEQKVEMWLREPYDGKAFREAVPLILTEKGERVRSKSEKLIADFLDRNHIPYKYEKPLFLDGYGTVYPDFTIISKRYGEVFWEHEGRMDDPEYAKSAVRKIISYEENGITLGKRLILTFETLEKVLNTKDLIRVLNQYL